MSEIAKCERCKEYKAAAVDFRHQATSAQNDYAALEEIASEQSATILRLHEKYEQLLAHHNALKEAARLLILTTQPVLGEDGHLWITEHAVDALAALVGEEKKYSREKCPKSDTWFANGGACGKAWDCRECKDAPAALVGEE